MSAHPEAYKRLAKKISENRNNPLVVDQCLELWLDYLFLATEWDAEQWGFKPDKWLVTERGLMDKRAEKAATSRQRATNT